MTARPILTVPNPILKQISTPVAAVDDAIRALMDEMLESMYEAKGIGLAAVQIGEPVRVTAGPSAPSGCKSMPTLPATLGGGCITERVAHGFTHCSSV